MVLTLTPRAETYRQYCSKMKRLKITPPPLTKIEFHRSWNEGLYKAEKERCFSRLSSKINTVYDYMTYYKECYEAERYEICKAITEVLKDLGFNTADTHKYIYGK